MRLATRICRAAHRTSASGQQGRSLPRKTCAGPSAAPSFVAPCGARLPTRASSTLSALPKDVLYLPMPKLSPSMTRATVTRWLKAEGDEVNEYDAILELTTDSLYAPGDAPIEGAAVDMIVELTEYGFVGKLFVAEGDTVEVGQAVMVLCEEEDQVEALSKAESPGIDFYGDDAGAKGLAIATYQGYLNGKTPAE